MRAVTWVMVACLAVLGAGCGGGGNDEAQPQQDCSTLTAPLDLPGAANVLSLRITNPGTEPRLLDLQGSVQVSGEAAGAAGGYSTLLLTDGQSPTGIGLVQAPPDGTAQARQPFSVRVLLPAGAVAVWNLAHAPLHRPYGWAHLRFTTAQICATPVAAG